MMRFRKPLIVAALAAVLTSTTPAHAGWPFGRRARSRCAVPAAPTACGAMTYRATTVQYAAVGYVTRPAATAQAAPQTTMAPTPIPQAATVDSGAAAFVAWLNATRQAYGLPPVGWDSSLEAVCQVNNQHQAAKGIGHHFLGHARRQNSAAGLMFPGVEAAWLASPGHASALLDPSIRAVGIAWFAGYCTFCAD